MIKPATPDDTSAACRTLAVYRKNLAKLKGADQALAVQRAKNAMNDNARELRAGFKVVS